MPSHGKQPALLCQARPQVRRRIPGVEWVALIHGSEIQGGLQLEERVYYGDGIGGFTTVIKYTNSMGDAEFSMLKSEKPEASSRADMMTQTLLAHFPMLFHRDVGTVRPASLISRTHRVPLGKTCSRCKNGRNSGRVGAAPTTFLI
jgi:hypothetical protein